MIPGLEELVDLGEEFVLVGTFKAGDGVPTLEELEGWHSLDLLLGGYVFQLVDVDLGEDDFSVEGLGLLGEPGGDHSAWTAPGGEIIDNDKLALEYLLETGIYGIC